MGHARLILAALVWSHQVSVVPSSPTPLARPTPSMSVHELLQECEPFAAELARHLPEGAIASDFVIRGSQALIFGAGGKVVKFVGRQHTAKKPGVMQRPFVQSCRREVEFFKSIRSGDERSSLAPLFPQTTLLLSTPESSDSCDEAFVLVLEDLFSAGYEQPPALDEAGAALALDALAQVHAHYWADAEVLRGDRGGFWPLERRPTAELEPEAAQVRWENVRTAFGACCRSLPPQLGRDIALAARELDDAVASTAVTLIHGDAKPANHFSSSLRAAVKLIDMQWCVIMLCRALTLYACGAFSSSLSCSRAPSLLRALPVNISASTSPPSPRPLPFPASRIPQQPPPIPELQTLTPNDNPSTLNPDLNPKP